jgi:predicted metal-dependent phosphoesterase TrpH
MTESLHTHTTLSDGKLTHRELFTLAGSLDISVLAFTDHDAVPSPETLRELETFRGRKTKWIIGTEITADLPRELKPDTAAMHIIGLFVDPLNEALLLHCRRAQESRVKRMRGIVSNLQNLGFVITAEDCFEMSGGESVGRPHVVEALMKHPENTLVMEKIRLEMADEAAHDPAVQARYSRMMERGEAQYPYTLFLSPDAYRPGYVEHDYIPDLDQAVKVIRDAGGVAVIAHYFTIRSKMPLEVFDRLLAEKRIDGAEVIYGLRAYNKDDQKLTQEQNTLKEIIARHGGISAGGSDAHSREDLEKYVSERWFSDESAGLTANILATGRVDKKFSSIE